MITIPTFVDFLTAEAQRLGWLVFQGASLVSRQFCGREGDADAELPDSVVGLKLGRYPVLICPIDLRSGEAVAAGLRAAHNQAVIARSYLLQEEIIDTHIMFLGVASEREEEKKKPRNESIGRYDFLVDQIERDETVCRKFVWLPNVHDPIASFNQFRERTFLARPWREMKSFDSAPLDHNERLVEDVLRGQGLNAASAAEWVKLAGSEFKDSKTMVDMLVDTMDLTP